MEEAVQKDRVRNQLSAELQQCSVGSVEGTHDRPRCSGDREACALSQDLLLQLFDLVQVWGLSLLGSQIHMAHQTYVSHTLGGRPVLLKLFTKFCVQAEKFKELRNQTIILSPPQCLGTAIATLKGRKQGIQKASSVPFCSRIMLQTQPEPWTSAYQSLSRHC